MKLDIVTGNDVPTNKENLYYMICHSGFPFMKLDIVTGNDVPTNKENKLMTVIMKYYNSEGLIAYILEKITKII